MKILRKCLPLLLVALVFGHPGLARAQGGGKGGEDAGGKGSPASGPGPSSGGGPSPASANGPSADEADPSAPAAGAPARESVNGNLRATFSKDQDRALEAVREGKALPISDIVSATRNITVGQIVDVQLSSAATNAQLIYRVTVLQPTGDVKRFSFDAMSAQLLRME